MTKNKAIVFSNNISVLENLQKQLFLHGYFDFTYLIVSNLEDFKAASSQAKQEDGKTILLCHNDEIDDVVSFLFKREDTANLIFDQAVQIESKQNNVVNNILIVPIELDFNKFLNVFLEKRESFCFSVFGKSENDIVETLKNLHIENFKIVTKTSLLHTVFCDKTFDLSEFKGYAFAGDNLAECCNLALKNRTLGVVQALCPVGLCGLNVKSMQVLISSHDLREQELDDEILKNPLCKECAFALAKNMFESVDVALVVVRIDEKVIVAVGDKEKVKVFSSTFEKNASFLDFENFAESKLFNFIQNEQNQMK